MKKTIKDINLKGKKVLLRVDYNVSLFDGMRVGDDTRIRQTLPTIEYLLKQGCTLYLISHLGRPEGKRQKQLSLRPVAEHLQILLKRKVLFFGEDLLKDEEIKRLKAIRNGAIILLENIRFYRGEETNENNFSRRLAGLGQIFVNDAFGVDHRAHASTVGLAAYLPSVAGFLLDKEVVMISQAMEKPKRPMVAIIGGAKAETKITLIDRLLEKADTLIIGGGVANTFLKAWGYEVGKSLVNYEMVELAKKLYWKAARSKTRMLLPSDVVVGDLAKNKYEGITDSSRIPPDMQALDIGPQSQAEFGAEISRAKTIIWNGPMGVCENPKFVTGTDFIYHVIAENRSSLSVVGGGDTLGALKEKDFLKTIDHVSTGGGAMLEFIEQGSLPGIDALLDK
ncbi:phosphoglycerate kinase [Candidatus Beckwithbacteria bacterium CG22_combo_CG10-13_8_21_14_all_01_47_9]|uniref:Phosphoglycerate kinase n=3 Tax=Candidatus Beckwithiibacteriota TaxID=1752726 RepID=A0A2H0E102_9BACT|nr:MAG: phosphoglycerate kinase [Candidatus Beckwithbacteria bacterium CG1_02_47_37]PIP88087.1 MAG: phosphoglycerate kinase [Candidatus Beckwithbacteria bacterium CG22_combo_CG10-13_8_21_14_all_01_47_9]PJA23242.1 MAG: phosphoglycerate kinase [Candidatus Beckwithbacteria bacterium CG_4_10_14_0_2_um_filter_47_25]